MNLELAYRCQMLPKSALNSRSTAERELLKAGWSQEVLGAELNAALSWARSQRLVADQEKSRRTRANKKTILKGNDAVEAMFASVGVDADHIIPNQNSVEG
jgi:hypothetical protein